jgi:hypothetical protein
MSNNPEPTRTSVLLSPPSLINPPENKPSITTTSIPSTSTQSSNNTQEPKTQQTQPNKEPSPASSSSTNSDEKLDPRVASLIKESILDIYLLRQKALEKARLKSDEELGVPATPILSRLKTASTTTSTSEMVSSTQIANNPKSEKNENEIEFDVDGDDDIEDDAAPLADIDDEYDGSDYEVDGPTLVTTSNSTASAVKRPANIALASIISPSYLNPSSSKSTVSSF